MSTEYKIKDTLKDEFKEESRVPVFETEAEWITFLIQNQAYPYCSKNKKIFFRRIKKNEGIDTFDKIIRYGAIEKLGIKTEEDCRLLRESIKTEIAKRKENKPIKEWSKDERPREMLIKDGAEKLPPAKLLAIILRVGDSADGISAEDLARKLLYRFGNFRALDSVSIPELCSVRGIGPAKAAQIKAALEIGKRFMREETEQKSRIKTVDDVVNFYRPYLRDLKEERFKIMLLDGRNKFIKDITISKGSLTESVVHPREVIKEATKESAAGIILVHNHPSGESEPTKDDIEITNRLVQACDLVGIRVLDHLIIGNDNHMSFVDRGLIKED